MGFPVVAQLIMNPTSIHDNGGSIPGLAQCRSQMRLRSHVAVAVAQAGGYSSDSTPSLGTSICCRSNPRKGKKTPPLKKNTDKEVIVPFLLRMLIRENVIPETTGFILRLRL